MRRRLVILDTSAPRREVVLEGEHLTIGRARDSVILLQDETVSRRHAVIRRVGSQLVVEDSGSATGTYVNGQRLRAAVLLDGDVLRFGEARGICRFDLETTDLERAMRDAAFAARAHARVVLREGELVVRRPLESAVSLIGNAPHCEVRLRDRRAPPEQALIRAVRGAFRVEPRSSTEPLLVNDSPRPVTEPTPLLTNSTLVLGEAQVLFLYDFTESGKALRDPLARLPRRRILREVARECGLLYSAARRLCRGVSGQGLGEVLVESGMVAPLAWQQVCRRLVAKPRPAAGRREGRRGEP